MGLSLAGKVAVVTGASKGLGEGMAIALAAAGARVALVSRDQGRLEGVARKIGEGGGEAKVFVADVTDENQVTLLQEAVATAFGNRVDILVNNAGINIRKPITEFKLEEWHQVMDSNLTSVFLFCRAFVPMMIGNGYGRIINLASTMAHVSLPGRTAYSASKTALLGLTRSLALELAGEMITVNCISPGACDTEINAPIMQNAELQAQLLSRIPLGRWGKPEEIASLAVYLCSPEAGYITGTDMVVDGGWIAQ